MLVSPIRSMAAFMILPLSLRRHPGDETVAGAILAQVSRTGKGDLDVFPGGPKRVMNAIRILPLRLAAATGKKGRFRPEGDRPPLAEGIPSGAGARNEEKEGASKS